MKKRTIQELHDKYIGHRKFAMIVDLLISQGYTINDIKEYNEQFKFKINDIELVYRKEWKASAREYVKYIEKIINDNERLNALWRNQNGQS